MAGPAPPASASQDELNAIVCGVLPRQGTWSDEEYLWLTDRSRRLIEFTDGYVQDLPMPTFSHQAILAFLYRLFHGWIGRTWIADQPSSHAAGQEGRYASRNASAARFASATCSEVIRLARRSINSRRGTSSMVYEVLGSQRSTMSSHL